MMNFIEEKKDEEEIPVIKRLVVSNYPNPFNPITTIAFSLPRDSDVKIEVFNIKGQKVKELYNEFTLKGHHTVLWNGQDDKGRSVSSGIYFYRVQTVDVIITKKMILLK